MLGAVGGDVGGVGQEGGVVVRVDFELGACYELIVEGGHGVSFGCGDE